MKLHRKQEVFEGRNHHSKNMENIQQLAAGLQNKIKKEKEYGRKRFVKTCEGR